MPGLSVLSELLGTSHTATRDGYIIKVVFPVDAGDFGVREHDRLGNSAATGGSTLRDGVVVQEYVTMLRASVDCTLPYSADELANSLVPRDVFDEGYEALKRAANAARTLLRDYLEIVRIECGQHWLGLSG